MENTKTSKQELLTPSYNDGTRTRMTICGHEAAHAAMCWHLGIPINYIQVMETTVLFGTLPEGRIGYDSANHSREDEVTMLTAGLAWEWRDTDKLISLYRLHAGEEMSEANDCMQIHWYMTEVLELCDGTQAYDDGVANLFQKVWKILEAKYLPAIDKLARKLDRADKLNAEEIYPFFEKN